MTPPDGDADGFWADTLTRTSHILAGILAEVLVRALPSPSALPEALLPEVSPGPERDRAMFALGAEVGYGAGLRRAAPRWDPGELASVRDALAEAGFEAMAALAGRAAAVVPERSASAGVW